MDDLSDKMLQSEFDRLADLKEQAIAGMYEIRIEQARRKDARIEEAEKHLKEPTRCAECDCANGGADCNWIKAKEPTRCAECDCANGGADCNWIKAKEAE